MKLILLDRYETGEVEGKLAIIIRRKPSQIPASIDMMLAHKAGMVEMDGPNSIVTYIFLLPDLFSKAEDELIRCGWSVKKD